MTCPLFAIALIAGALPLQGQQRPTMTLDEALAIARDRNPSYRSAVYQIDAASLDARSRVGAFLPTLSASMGWQGYSSTTLTGQDDFGRSVSLPDPVTYRRSSASQSLSSSVRLFDGLRNINDLRAARHSVSAADAAARVQGLQIEADVRQRFYDALRAERLIELEERLLESAREQLEANERRFRVAAATQVDVLGAQIEVASQEQAVESRRGEARQARLSVLEALGILGEVGDFEPSGTLPDVFDPNVLDAVDLVSRALSANPLISQRQFEAASAERTAAAARGSWLPTVDLSASFARGLNEQEYGAFFDFNPGQDRGYSFSLQVGWNLFSGFQRSQQIGQANVGLRQAEENLRQAELGVEQQVRAALIQVTNTHDALDIQRRSTALSRQRVDLAREQYQTGAAGMDFTSLQQIIREASNQERALVDAEYQFALALLNLEQQVGDRVAPLP